MLWQGNISDTGSIVIRKSRKKTGNPMLNEI